MRSIAVHYLEFGQRKKMEALSVYRIGDHTVTVNVNTSYHSILQVTLLLLYNWRKAAVRHAGVAVRLRDLVIFTILKILKCHLKESATLIHS